MQLYVDDENSHSGDCSGAGLPAADVTVPTCTVPLTRDRVGTQSVGAAATVILKKKTIQSCYRDDPEHKRAPARHA